MTLTRNQIHERITDIAGQIKAQRAIVAEAEKQAEEQARLADIAAQAVTRATERLGTLLTERADLTQAYADAASKAGEDTPTIEEQAVAEFHSGEPVTPYPNGESRLNAIFHEATNP